MRLARPIVTRTVDPDMRERVNGMLAIEALAHYGPGPYPVYNRDPGTSFNQYFEVPVANLENPDLAPELFSMMDAMGPGSGHTLRYEVSDVDSYGRALVIIEGHGPLVPPAPATHA